MSEQAPRLYLVAPPLSAAEDLSGKLDAALDAGDIASLLLPVDLADLATARKVIPRLAAQGQARGAAVLVEHSADLALETGADGVEIKGRGEALTGAVKRLSPGNIVGAAGLVSRHDAMEAGEVGVDYVVFGDNEAAREEIAELVRWWAEVFTTPCVAVARRLEDIGRLAAAGADFVMLGDCVWKDERGPAQAVAEAMERLRGAR